MSKDAKVVVVGAGPTGLGAAIRLTETGHAEWRLVDAAPVPGGLSRSYVDDKGFTWDFGGHVIFSHYAYFDDVMDLAVPEWNTLKRISHVRAGGVWVPYPFQNNIHRLPPEERARCLAGLEEAVARRGTFAAKPANFEEAFVRDFGDGIADVFMRPYNTKVWATPPSRMGTGWTGERVAQVDIARVRHCVETGEDDDGWGPNATFRFPRTGGTGGIYASLARRLPAERLRLGPDAQVTAVDARGRTVTLASGETLPYDALLSTMPLDVLLRLVADGLGDAPLEGLPAPARLREVADALTFSSTHVVGVGLRGAPGPHLSDACWMYFPDPAIPFYRATVFSNYSRSHVPDEGCWSLMVEVSEMLGGGGGSGAAPRGAEELVAACVQGCRDAGLITEADEVVSTAHYYEYHGYPTPSLDRDALLAEVVEPLRAHAGIYSRGRFGGWKYEAGNQDHSMLQGVEAVDRIRGDDAGEVPGELEPTYLTPDVVNTRRGKRRCTFTTALKEAETGATKP